MKRLLQAVALLQVVLVLGLVARIVTVLSTPLPEFAEVPDLPAEKPLPPARPPVRVPPALTEEIVGHDLFDESRGMNQEIDVDGIVVDETPVAPPSTVKLVGIMMLGAEPVGILLDPNIKPEQQSVRKGEMFGEYEITDIHPRGLTLLGSGGQKYEIPLRIEAVAAGAIPPPPPPQRPAAGGAAAAGAAPAGKAPVARPVTAKPASAAAPKADDGKVQTARERAQAIAQRNAEMRKNNAEGGKNQQNDNEGGGQAGPDPVQARLEALRQLREAAKAR